MKKLNLNILKKGLFTLVILFAAPVLAQAQDAEPSFFERATEQDLLILFVLGLALVVSVLVLMVAIYTLTVLKVIVNKDKEKAGVAVEAEPSFWSSFNKTMTDAVPIEKERTILLDHEYDGIRELDNHLPPWWKWLFYFTIAWSVVYLIVYHVTGTLPLQEEEYQMELAEARSAVEARQVASTESIDESTVEFSDDPGHLANGQKLYERNCAVCHQNDGGGLVGPNFTDKYWIHGGSMQDIFRVVKYGVPEKGMIAWQDQLSPADMRDVSSYILTFQGTTPANGKEPQGDLYEPAAAPADEESTEEASTEVQANN
ncbi:MAG: cbb3-type cytochrome c oxidase N-terminal domain-containing protein [Cyclobacteriaceae bacterium]